MNRTTSTRRTPGRMLTARLLAACAAAAGLLVGALPAQAAAPAADGMATAWVRSAHLVPGLGTMSISLVPFAGDAAGEVTKPGVPPADSADGARVVEPSSRYGQASEYRQIPQGLYTVAVRPAGAAPDSDPILTGTLDATADQAYTLAALGTKDSPRVQAISDDLRRPEAGSASVRLLAAATGVSSATVTAQGGPVVAEDAQFGRPTGYAAVPAGPWTLDVATTRGSGGQSMRGEALTGKVDLASGGVYTVLLLDAADGGLRLQPLVDAQGVGEAPAGGVQTGGGGTAERPADPRVLGGLGLAGTGALALAVLAARRRALATVRAS